MAEQTLTINTLAATVITPSDVSQFSLDDIAPNIINGGGGTIVDVSGIVTLASQVAELDSEVTVLQTNVADLQEDVSGLDAAVAQAQTTATSAASIANAAVATANSAKSTAQYALKAGTATMLKYTDQYGNTNALKVRLDESHRIDFEDEDGDRLITALAANATALDYTTPEGRMGHITASVSAKQITFLDSSGDALSVAGSGSGGGNTATAQYALKAGTAQYTLKSSTAQYALKAGTAQYALKVGTAQYTLETDNALWASRATTLQYVRTDNNQYGLLEARIDGGQLTFSDLQGNELSVAGGSSGGDGTATSLTYKGAALVTVADGSVEFSENAERIFIDSTSGGTSLKDTILLYAGGSSGGAGFNGTFTGDVDLSSAGAGMRLNVSSATLTGGAVVVGNSLYNGNQIGFDSDGISIGTADYDGTTLQIYRFNKVSINSHTARGIAGAIESYLTGGSGSGDATGLMYWAHQDDSNAEGSARLIIDPNSNTFQFYTDEGPVLAATAGGTGSGGGSTDTAQYALYAGDLQPYKASNWRGSSSGLFRDAAGVTYLGYASKQPYASASSLEVGIIIDPEGDGSTSWQHTSIAILAPEELNIQAERVHLKSVVGRNTSLHIGLFSTVSIHDVTAQRIAAELSDYLSGGSGGFSGTYTGPVTLHSSTDVNKSTLRLTNNDLWLEGVHIRLDASSKLFIANDAEKIAIGNSTSLKDTILLYAGSGGGSSSTGYPALMAPNDSSLYYGITSPDSSAGFSFGSFADANGDTPAATIQAHDNSINIESFDESGTSLAYGLWVKPGNLKFGVADNGYPDELRQGVYIPGAPGYNDRPLYVGEMPSTSQVYGLMAKSSIVGVGNTWYDSSAHVDTGVLVNTDTTLVQAKSSDGEASLLLDASSSIATLSAIFTLNCKETTLGEADWTKLKQLADNADALLALLNQ